jgi:hypothetical protein
MKRLSLVLLLFAVACLLMGMGDAPPGKVPKTDRNFAATYVDQMDVKTECTEVSVDGNTFIEGKRGDGNLAIGFEKIKSILFRMKNNELLGYVTLYDGSETIIMLDKKKKAYGRTPAGAFQINLSDLKKMIINPRQVSGPRG